MKITAPEYYHQFRCIASDCPDSCCHEWILDIDAESAALYRNLPGDLGDRLRQVLQEEDGCIFMANENGRCPMWRADGLCRIQAELGHDALSHTCREFPRLRHDYGTFQEWDLELSCPEAARQIFAQPQPDMVTTCAEAAAEADYDQQTMAQLLRSRETAYALLNNIAYPVNQRLAILLLFAHNVQSELDGGQTATADPAEDLARAKKLAVTGDFAAVLHFFRELEILTDRWSSLLRHAVDAPCWDEKLRSFVCYGIRRYWLQAVSDYDLIGRVKFIIFCCILLSRLPGDLCANAQLLSKEIENDPDNLEAIFDGAYTAPALTDLNLLSLLLG